MSIDRSWFAFLFALTLNVACSSSSGSSSTTAEDGGAKGSDAAAIPADAAMAAYDGSSEAAAPDGPAAMPNAPDGGAGDSGDDGSSSCNLSDRSIILQPVLNYTSGTDPAECPSASNNNIVSASCSLAPAGGCIANATCSVAFSNAGSSTIITETGAVTVTGSKAVGAIGWQDPSGITCNQSISGTVSLGTGMPGVCSQTCSNMTPNGEMGCNPCLMAACPSQYQACLSDNASGCINCNQLLSGTAGSGIQCTNTDQIVFSLLGCGCSPAACN
jgi:hypothetical protein